MQESPVDSSHIYELIKGALTDDINNREIFMKGIDYSYYYEQVDWFVSILNNIELYLLNKGIKFECFEEKKNVYQ